MGRTDRQTESPDRAAGLAWPHWPQGSKALREFIEL